jgi:hypothetical protein
VGSLLGWEVPESSEYLADRWVVEMNHNTSKAPCWSRASRAMWNPSASPWKGIPSGSFRRDAESAHARRGHPLRQRSADGQINGIFCSPPCTAIRWRITTCTRCSIVAGFPGARVYVHCGMLSVGFRKKLGLHSPFDMRYSNPIDLHAVALAFPDLPFVIPHFGAGYLSRSSDGGRPVPEHLFRYLQLEPLDAMRAFGNRSRRVFSAKRSMSSDRNGCSSEPTPPTRSMIAQVQALEDAKASDESCRPSSAATCCALIASISAK